MPNQVALGGLPSRSTEATSYTGHNASMRKWCVLKWRLCGGTWGVAMLTLLSSMLFGSDIILWRVAQA